MERNDIWKKLLFPPLWLILLLSLLCAVGLPVIFVKGFTEHPLVYGFYALAFYTVCVLFLYCAAVLPKKYKSIKEKVYANPIGHRYMTDAAFRTHVSLYGTLGVNLLYVGLNIVSWRLYDTLWFVVLAVYYVILAVMRFLLLRYVRGRGLGTDRLGELKRARLCSCVLLLLNFVLTGAVMMILYQNKGFEYHGILIYAMAAYTFYITVHAITALVRYRKYRSPIMTVSKIISLCAALVSMLALETAMFAQFGGDMSAQAQRLMIALTGAGVSIVVISLSAFMIVRSAKEIKEINESGREKRDI